MKIVDNTPSSNPIWTIFIKAKFSRIVINRIRIKIAFHQFIFRCEDNHSNVLYFAHKNPVIAAPVGEMKVNKGILMIMNLINIQIKMSKITSWNFYLFCWKLLRIEALRLAKINKKLHTTKKRHLQMAYEERYLNR